MAKFRRLVKYLVVLPDLHSVMKLKLKLFLYFTTRENGSLPKTPKIIHKGGLRLENSSKG